MHNNRLRVFFFRCSKATWSKVIKYKYTADLRLYTRHIAFFFFLLSHSLSFYFSIFFSHIFTQLVYNRLVLYLFLSPLCYPTQMFIYLHKSNRIHGISGFNIYVQYSVHHLNGGERKKWTYVWVEQCFLFFIYNIYRIFTFLACITLHNDGQK